MNTYVRTYFVTRFCRATSLLVGLVALAALPAFAQTTVGPYSFTPTSASGVVQGQAEIDGQPASAGDIVVAYDPDGVVAGAAEVIMNGGIAYINVTVYGDDATTGGVDEGMSPGDGITLALYDASMGTELGGVGVGTWQNANGAPIPGLNDPNAVFGFQGVVVVPGAPTLSSPADGSTDASLAPTVSWSAVGSATAYDLEVSTDAGFGSTVSSSTGLGATSVGLSGLALSTEYFWRVRATNSAGASAWAGPWSFTTRDPVVPPAPVLALPADAATGVSTVVQFTWQAATDADTYEIQAATDAQFTDVVESATGLGTTAHTASLAEYLTSYYWRVRATGAGGTGDWSSVFSFQTEAPPPPGAPALTAPTDGATGVAMSPVLSWQAGTATSFDVEVASDAAFADVVASGSDLIDASFPASGLTTLTEYFWRVRAYNVSGAGPWSSTRSFTTVAPDAPGAIGLLAPANGTTGAATSQELTWTASAVATSYDVEIATTQDFSSGVQSLPVSGEASGIVSAQATGLDWLTTYWWRVRGQNAGGAGAWSAPRSFTTIIQAPGVPAGSAPADGAVDQPGSVSLVWAAADRAATYHVQVADNASFSGLFADEAGLMGTSFDLTGLAPATTYFWRVRATNEGGTGEWSPVRTFATVVGAPGAPAPQAPQAGALGVPLPAPFSWAASAGAATYALQVATEAGFANVVADVTTPSAMTSLEIPGLLNETTYFWRVRAVNAGGESPWSDVRTFTTIVAAPGAVLGTSPVDGAEGMSTSPGVAWTAAARADEYRVQVATDDQFSAGSLVADESGVAASPFTVTGLTHLTTYWWRVRASNEGGDGPWGSIQRFTTGPPAPPAAPLLVTPAADAVSVPVVATLTWNADVDAESWEVQVSPTPAFSELIWSKAGVPATGATISASVATATTDSLDFSATYYWRVRARNVGGAGEWSASWSFTTMALPAPPAAVLAEPADKSTGVGGTPVLRWTRDPIATSYDVQVSNFGALLVDTTGVLTSSLDISGLSGNTEYFWRVRSRNATGTGPWSPSFSFVTAVSVGVDEVHPTAFALGVPYPNPFSQATTIPLELDRPAQVRMDLVDLLGRSVQTVLDGMLPAGHHVLHLDAGVHPLPPGRYFLRARTGDGRTQTVSVTRLP